MLASTTNVDKCYQLLGICREASLDELKAAYRTHARRWHPDLNPGNHEAHQHFILLSHAYQVLLEVLAAPIAATAPIPPAPRTQTANTASPEERDESELKWQLYYELQSLLKQEQYLKAIVLIEGLARHSPQDTQICQWQGIIYSQFGYKLMKRRELTKAKIYLHKALKVDPHNRQLLAEVEQALNRIALLS